MARSQTRFVCGSCGESFLRWEGQCRTCGGWNTLVETIVRDEPRAARRSVGASAGVGGAPAVVESLARISDADLPRLSLGIGSADIVVHVLPPLVDV